MHLDVSTCVTINWLASILLGTTDDLWEALLPRKRCLEISEIDRNWDVERNYFSFFFSLSLFIHLWNSFLEFLFVFMNTPNFHFNVELIQLRLISNRRQNFAFCVRFCWCLAVTWLNVFILSPLISVPTEILCSTKILK